MRSFEWISVAAEFELEALILKSDWVYSFHVFCILILGHESQLLLLEGFIDLEFDQILVVSQMDLAVQFVLQSHIVPIELALDSEQAADVADPLDRLSICVLQDSFEVTWFDILNESTVVIQARPRCYGDVTSICLHDQVSDTLHILREETQVGQLRDPVLDLVTDKVSGLDQQSPSQP